MARSRAGGAAVRSAERRAPKVALGPGLHGGYIELKLDRSFRVRTAAGERITARLGAAVDPALADECLRAGRMVILVDGAAGPEIAGALQTSVALSRDADGIVAIDARELRLRAERAALIEVGPVSIAAEESGAVRIEGDRMVIDMGAFLRVLAAKVELP